MPAVSPSAPEHFAAPELTADQVHVLSFGLDGDASSSLALVEGLTPDEREQAARYRHPRDRRRFVSGRAQLRRILGAYTGIAPAHLRFVNGPHGKPALADGGAKHALQFNLSHSAERALLGVSIGRMVGVDIERQHELAESEDIARRHFAPVEFAQWLALPAAQRSDAFFSCWTRKEAYVKAVGGGLSMDLHAFEVDIDPNVSLCSLRIDGSKATASAWTLWAWRPQAGFRAALAVHGHGLSLRHVELA